MKKIFFKPLSTGIFTLLLLASNLIANDKLVIWATVDQKINNTKATNDLYNFLEKNYPDINKNIKIHSNKPSHITIAIAGIVKEENGKKYIIKKGKKVLLEDVVSAVEKAISNNKINYQDKIKFNLKSGSRFSDPINDKYFYIIQELSIKKNHPLENLGRAIKKELYNVGLNVGKFDPRVSSTLISSDDPKSLNQLQYLQNNPKLWKTIQNMPAANGLTYSKVQILINKGNTIEAIKTYDL